VAVSNRTLPSSGVVLCNLRKLTTLTRSSAEYNSRLVAYRKAIAAAAASSSSSGAAASSSSASSPTKRGDQNKARPLVKDGVINVFTRDGATKEYDAVLRGGTRKQIQYENPMEAAPCFIWHGYW
ncbi:unnamed protein product, partial [Amoebophrya sp. A25]